MAAFPTVAPLERNSARVCDRVNVIYDSGVIKKKTRKETKRLYQIKCVLEM